MVHLPVCQERVCFSAQPHPPSVSDRELYQQLSNKFQPSVRERADEQAQRASQFQVVLIAHIRIWNLSHKMKYK